MDGVDGRDAALLTDLYELTMAASYLRSGMVGEATFDLTVRSLPPGRNFLVACGLEQALQYLETFRFDEDAIAALAFLRVFDTSMLESLRTLRFRGDVWAMQEGEVVFAGEPLLRVTASLPEAQLVESYLLNCITFQTLVASKSARVRLACRDQSFVDFALRRTHGPSAALFAARAAYIAGAQGTSNVLAAARWDIPASGTMAHSYVLAFPNELEAFRRYAQDFPDRAVLLIDTFDTLIGAQRAARVGVELASKGHRLQAVRIDSGDLAKDARAVRRILDEAGLSDTRILLSGDLDEHIIDSMLRDGVPVDSFGVGTQLGTSGDAPSLGGVYKLAMFEGVPRMKLSRDKLTLPGLKQVHRILAAGRAVGDVIALDSEIVPHARPLLHRVMTAGRRLQPTRPLTDARRHFERALAELPEAVTSLQPSEAAHLPVTWSPALSRLVERTRDEVRIRNPAV